MKKTIATLSLMALMLGAATAFGGATKQGKKPAMTNSATNNTATNTDKGKHKSKHKGKHTAKPKSAPAATKPSGK